MSKTLQVSLSYVVLIELAGLLALLVSVGAAAVLYDPHGIGIDDANIYFVYARNLIEGHGFVYNSGGERVEGFTSLLWTLVCAFLFLFFESPQRPLLLLNTLLVSSALFFLYRTVDWKLSRDERVVLLLCFLIWICGNPDFLGWTVVSLLETGLWAWALMIVSGSLVRCLLDPAEETRTHRRSFLLCITLLPLIRPESLVWGPLLLLIYVVVSFVAGKKKERYRKDILIAGGLHLLSTAGIFLWRLLYFGYPFPNTYYAKVSSSFFDNLVGGASYLEQFLLFAPGVSFSLLGVLLFVISAKRIDRWKKNVVLLLVVLFFISITLPLATGGDHFVQFRLYQPLIPLIPLLVALTSSMRSREIEISIIAKGGLILCLIGGLLTPTLNRARWFNEGSGLHLSREVRLARLEQSRALLLNKFFSGLDTYPSLATTAAGAIKLHYYGTIIDLFGLNNVRLGHSNGRRVGLHGHSAYQEEALFEQKPDLLFVSRSSNLFQQLQEQWSGFGLGRLFESKRLYEEYAAVGISREGVGTVFSYVRRDYLKVLETNGYSIFEVMHEN